MKRPSTSFAVLIERRKKKATTSFRKVESNGYLDPWGREKEEGEDWSLLIGGGTIPTPKGVEWIREAGKEGRGRGATFVNHKGHVGTKPLRNV